MPRNASAADELRALARATRAHLEREADVRRGDLWTLAAAEPTSPRKERTMPKRARATATATPAEPVPAGFLSLKDDTLARVETEVRGCTRCGLAETRTKAVPGAGTGKAGIVFVGEAPGASEDAKGEPFVGRAGELLGKMLAAMNEKQLIPGVDVTREAVYITNVLKCRPPENRNPLPHEIEACSPYLVRQLRLLEPRVICCLGKFAAELLVGAKGTIGGMRGTIYRYGDAKLIVTYHPAACLRNPAYKRPVWEDLKLLAREYQNAT